MPQSILKPDAPGDLAEWTPAGTPGANWEAVSNQAPTRVVLAQLAGLRDRHALPSLPVGATGVNLVTAFGSCAGDLDDVSASTMRLVLRLAGVDALGAIFTPLEGGYIESSHAFPLAPDGLAWTVAKVNALQLGIDSVAIYNTGLNVDELWLAVDWEAGAPDVVGETTDVELPRARYPLEANEALTPVDIPASDWPEAD